MCGAQWDDALTKKSTIMSGQTLLLGERYHLRHPSGETGDYQLLHYNPRSGKHTVRDMRSGSSETKRMVLDGHSVVRRIRQSTSSTTQLYILKTGAGIYKMGCTDDLMARMRAGRTWCPDMVKVASRTIPKPKTGNWRRYENKLHARFSSNRCRNGGSEVFKLSTHDAKNASQYMSRMRFD